MLPIFYPEFLLIKVVRKVFFSSHKQDVPLEKDRRIAEKLSNFIPVIIVYYVLQLYRHFACIAGDGD